MNDGRRGSVAAAGQRFDIVFDDAPTQNFPTCQTPDKRQGLCKPLAQCAIFYAEIPSLLERPCQTRSAQNGVCCPLDKTSNGKPSTGGPKFPIRPGVGNDGVLSSPPPPDVPIPKISARQLQEVAEMSLKTFKIRIDRIQDILFNKKSLPLENCPSVCILKHIPICINQVTIPKGTPAASHQKFFATTNQVLDIGSNAQLNLETSMNVLNNFQLTPLQGTFALPKFSVKGTAAEKACPGESQCNPSYPYRTIDGSCNNQENVDWGKSQTAFQRILQPKYGDGLNSPRVTATGQPLPSPRLVSDRFIPDENRPYRNLTLMVMQWGQFVDHDLTHTPIVKGENSTGISCCENGQPLEASLRHPDCFPIEITPEDSFYKQFNQRCMEFVRSLPAPRKECNLGPREQMTQVTHLLDGSMIYGSTERRATSLREGVGGRLLVQTNGGREHMPANPNECSDANQEKFCFRAGDLRVNEQVHLALIHTIWFREHNRVARELEILNPHWADETLYQETRRIVIAELQHITYNEWLPLILGPNYMRTFELQPTQKGYTQLYNPSIDPSVTNAFASAAFRFGHSMIQGVVKMFNPFGASRNKPFSQTQFQPFEVYDSCDDLVRGLANQESQRMDRFASQAVTNHLFEGQSGFGLDLFALNIQRGRDHALPPYNDWREVCGLKRLNSWRDFEAVADKAMADSLSTLYPNVDEVDLFIGGVSEKPLDGAVLGPTFTCIVGDQFARLRRGDRFFYEEVTARFTEAQLDQIKKVSLARLLCDNSDDITVIQPLIFQKASFLNQRMPCNSESIPGIDFRFWTEKRRGGGSGQTQRQNERPRGGSGQGNNNSNRRRNR
ncbi:Chorion peroxidase [Orchesella cincta]|uniref:Chorion peroxidase n=1 Tax=Orchesella cincta TaxID=48709 RepID=A0A1D2MQ77_ORCCI|nr:Chorion peroxidase [Orchesella cincta]